MNKVILIFTIVSIGLNALTLKAPLTFEEMSMETRAELAEMSTEEFILISSVVEAESDRTTESTEGRRYIALCILCRVMDSRFPDTISEVLTQRGQFSTVRNGHSVTERTDLSDQAVIEAVEWIDSGEDYPWVLFFNCRGYNYGTAYDRIGGNYFMTLEPMREEVDDE
jgi:N-acetylmuramoyl-L-alanine amidase